ncbi:D-alanine--poly(phosphoribitol) ligase [Streptomyces sp. NPDC020965]|uniref:D-alanine--poly(phosphoribitol) ligase n=1 Tax=Streptomyces sp. NPDC020965 TaxID=3365105 RepID=UPI00378AD48B
MHAADHALHARFLRGLACAPDRPAVRFGGRTLTYAQAHRTALTWAGSLLRATPEPPAAVGVLADKGIPAYLGILTALYAGAAVVPLRPDFPAARTAEMMRAAGVTAVIADGRGRRLLPELLADRRDTAVLAADEEGAPADESPADGSAPGRRVAIDEGYALTAPRDVVPDDTAYVLFTSGSTGRPKGVPLSHGNIAHYFEVLDARYDFTADDVFTQTFDLNFDCSLFDLFCAWGAGASVIQIPPQAYRDLPAHLAEQGVTVWFSTPSSIALVRRLGGLAPGSLPTLRWSFFAGEALKCADTEDWQRAAPASFVENLYGPTELTVTVTAHRWSPEVSPVVGANGVVPIGPLHKGLDHVLIDADGLPHPDTGELCVTGPQMAGRYLDPADDHGRFLDHDGRRWYRTGDRVRLAPGGELVYLGRMDAQVQIQGWRVELAEVDHALQGCEGVGEAVTVGAATDAGTELVVFYTAPAPVPPVRFAAVLRATLPDGVVPRHYRHVAELPLNSNRKIDRRALTARAEELLG